MKLRKLIIAGICVCSLCSFSTIAPVQVDATSCSTNIEPVQTTRNRFNNVDKHEDRYEYLRGFRFGEFGGDYLDVFDLCCEGTMLTTFQIGYMDGIKYYRYLNSHSHGGGGGGDNSNTVLTKDDGSNTVLN